MKRYLVFALVGPFLAGFLLLLTSTYESGYWTRNDAAGKLFTIFFMTLQYSYLFGLLPSLMIGAVDDILLHIKWLGPVPRMLLVGLFAFIAAALTYGSREPGSGVLQFILYGLVGFVPATIASWLVHKFFEKAQPTEAS